jgi:[ribosomal protein S18]-alanine N-acetyltransferase
VIRELREEDLEAVLAIEIASAPHPWTAGIFADELAQGGTRRYVVAIDDSRVVGFCGLLLSLDEGHITNIAVDPTLRRRGYAHAMMLVTVRTAIAKSLRALTLEVRVSNKAAIALYQRFGFAPGGVRPRYYPDNGEDALIMWAHDIDTAAYSLRLAGLATQQSQHRQQTQPRQQREDQGVDSGAFYTSEVTERDSEFDAGLPGPAVSPNGNSAEHDRCVVSQGQE